MTLPTPQERISGGLIGLLVGDALGVPYEFHPPSDIPPTDMIEFSPPIDFDRSHDSVAPGTWSDDGAQALCLLASLLDRDQLDVNDFGQRLVLWYDQGYMAVDNIVFDVGITTGKAIRAMRAGVTPFDAGSTDVHENGNGSLMRTLPLALWHQGSDAELVRDAHLQSHVTHAHLRSQVCCALYCLWARRILNEVATPWEDAVQSLRGLYEHSPDALQELEWSIRPNDPTGGNGTGYVVDCLRSARNVLETGNYETVVRAAVSLGNDTDTTACVAGGVAGLRYGVNNIPQRWREMLRGQAIFEPLLKQLLQRYQPSPT